VPEQGGWGGAAEGAAEAVVESGRAASEVAARPVHGFAERKVETWFVGDMATVEFVDVPGGPVAVGTPTGSLTD
jgi:hypothetical protein